jgi:predicted Zn-dependent peptidase
MATPLGNAAARFETSEQIANQLARLSLNSQPLDYVQRSLNRMSSATAADCEALLKRTVSPNQWAIVVVGDADKISKDLKAIAPVTLLDRDGKEKTESVAP